MRLDSDPVRLARQPIRTVARTRLVQVPRKVVLVASANRRVTRLDPLLKIHQVHLAQPIKAQASVRLHLAHRQIKTPGSVPPLKTLRSARRHPPQNQIPSGRALPIHQLLDRPIRQRPSVPLPVSPNQKHQRN